MGRCNCEVPLTFSDLTFSHTEINNDLTYSWVVGIHNPLLVLLMSPWENIHRYTCIRGPWVFPWICLQVPMGYLYLHHGLLECSSVSLNIQVVHNCHRHGWASSLCQECSEEGWLIVSGMRGIFRIEWLHFVILNLALLYILDCIQELFGGGDWVSKNCKLRLYSGQLFDDNLVPLNVGECAARGEECGLELSEFGELVLDRPVSVHLLWLEFGKS